MTECAVTDWGWVLFEASQLRVRVLSSATDDDQ